MLVPPTPLRTFASMDSRHIHPMALDMPGTAVKENHGRPSYSVKKKTYLTVWPMDDRAVLKLTPKQQDHFCGTYPDAVSPVETKLGKHGWTSISLQDVNESLFRYILDLAWRNVAPKWLIPTRVPPPLER